MADQNTDAKREFYSEILRYVFTFNGACEWAYSHGSDVFFRDLALRLFVTESLWAELSGALFAHVRRG